MNPYKIEELSYWEYSNRPEKHIPSEGAVLVKRTEEKEFGKDGETIVTVQYEYVSLQKYPKYTDQDQIYLRADDILTICDPSSVVLECYQKTVG